MRKLALLFLVITIAACKPSRQKQAEALVKGYLDTSLNDPKSYESVSFGPLTKDDEGDWLIKHIYRFKNKTGGVITKKTWFVIDTGFKNVNCCLVPDNSKAKTNQVATDSAIMNDTSAKDTSKK